MTLRTLMTVVIAGLLLISLVLTVVYLAATRRIASRETETGDALPPGVPGRLIRVGAHRVHVVERGVGPAILLVHGTAGTTLDWETAVLDDLAQDHRVVAVDLYGMGFSDRDDSFAYGFTLWADQLAGTLDALAITQYEGLLGGQQETGGRRNGDYGSRNSGSPADDHPFSPQAP